MFEQISRDIDETNLRHKRQANTVKMYLAMMACIVLVLAMLGAMLLVVLLSEKIGANISTTLSDPMAGCPWCEPPSQ